MSKFTKKIIQVLMIFSVAMVLATGLFSLTYLMNKPEAEKIKDIRIDNEELTDPQVNISGLRYNTNDQGEIITDGSGDDNYVQYLNEQNEYIPIDLEVVESADDYLFENITNVSKTYFDSSTKESANFIKYEVVGDHSVEFSFVDALESVPVATDNTVTYKNIYQGMDAKYTITGGMLFEEIILEEYQEVDDIIQEMELENVYYKEQSDQSITFHDIKTGYKVFEIPRPLMYELDNQDNKHAGISYEISEEGNNVLIKKIINSSGQEWLKNATYPVAIDASISIPPPVAITLLPATFLDSVDGPMIQININDANIGTATGFVMQYYNNTVLDWTELCNVDFPGTIVGWTTCNAGIGRYQRVGSYMDFQHVDADPNILTYYRVALKGSLPFGSSNGVLTIAGLTPLDIEIDVNDSGCDGGCFYVYGVSGVDLYVQKRKMSDGSLLTGWGDGGSGQTKVFVNSTWGGGAPSTVDPMGMGIDSANVYFAGAKSWNSYPRTAAVDRSTGARVWEREFTTFGVNQTIAMYDIVSDGIYTYSVGKGLSNPGGGYWEFIKQRAVDGVPCENNNCGSTEAWGSNGGSTLFVGNVTGYVSDIVIDNNASGSVYAIGYYGNGGAYTDVRIAAKAKRNATDRGYLTFTNGNNKYKSSILFDNNLNKVFAGNIYSSASPILGGFARFATYPSAFAYDPVSSGNPGHATNAQFFETADMAPWDNNSVMVLGNTGDASHGATSDWIYDYRSATSLAGLIDSAVVSTSGNNALRLKTDANREYVYALGTDDSNNTRIEKRQIDIVSVFDLPLGNKACDEAASDWPSCLNFTGVMDSIPLYRYPRATEVTTTPTIAPATDWDRIYLSDWRGAISPPPSQPKQNPADTEYCIGVTGDIFDGSVRINGDTYYGGAQNITSQNLYPPHSNDGTFDIVHYIQSGATSPDCLIYNTGSSMSFLPDTTTTQSLYPNHPYQVGLYARQFDSSDGDGGRLTPPVNTASTYTLPRVVQAPTVTNVEATTFTISVDKDASSSPTGGDWENPNYTNYSIRIVQGATTRYILPTVGTGATFLTSTENFYDYDSSAGATTHWYGASGRNATGAQPGTTYTVSVRAQTEDGSAYSAWSAGTTFTTKLLPPDQPSVDCGFIKNNIFSPPPLGYYCDVDITDSQNTGTIYYQIERQRCNLSGASCSGWSVFQNYSTSKTFVDESAFPGLNCSLNETSYQYKVTARKWTGSSWIYSDASLIGDDTLPPCQPGTPSANSKTYNSITLGWVAPVGGEVINKYNISRPIGNFYSLLGTTINDTPQYTVLGLFPNRAYLFAITGIDNRVPEREGNYSNSSASIYTLAEDPGISVDCRYGFPGTNYNCTVNIDIKNNPSNTTYDLEVRSCNINSSICSGWSSVLNAEVYAGPYTYSSLTCSTSTSLYEYHVRAINVEGNTTNYFSASDTLPPCAPNTPTHTNLGQTTTRLRWNYDNTDTGGADVVDYGVTFDSLAEAWISSTNTYGYTANTLLENTNHSARRRGRDSRGRIGAVSTTNNAYTSIATVTNILFNIYTPNSLNISAVPNPQNLGITSQSGIWFRETTGTNWPSVRHTTNTATHSSLSSNTKYCYQAQTKNGNGDSTGYNPTTPVCSYTYVVVPKRPIVDYSSTRQEVNLIVRSDDINDYTQYAICVSRHNSDDSIDSKYVLADTDDDGITSVDWGCSDPLCSNQIDCEGTGIGQCNAIWDPNTTNCTPNGNTPDNTGHWARLTTGYSSPSVDWGGADGIQIVGLDASTKYDFKVKATNENATNGGPEGNNPKNWTAFGPEATIFLVKNNVVGWAWSANIGWVSMNCLNLFTNPSLGYSCDTGNDWGINTSFEPTRQINPLEGYAWSASGQAKGIGSCVGGANIGNECFSDVDCPSSTCAGGGAVKTGLGWISFNKSVCSNDAQQGCVNDNECTGVCVDTPAEEISEDILVAGDTPDSITYGFCYNDTVLNNGEKYGICSDNNTKKCTETDITACDDILTATCILETCKSGPLTCSDYDGGPIIEECRATATASFNGETREIEGWARILSMKEQGVATGFSDWGWLQLGGQYDDGQGNTGDYNLTGTEIDSQLFLGDPDVSANELSLYTFFGWGWNADISDYVANSDWLAATNVSDSSSARLGFDGVHNTAMVLDSKGNPHIAWEVYDRVNNYNDIYYLKLEAGKWVTVSGVEYHPGATDPHSSMLSVGYGTGFFDEGKEIRDPSIALGSDDRLQLAGMNNLGTNTSNLNIFYTTWNGSNWTSADGVTLGYDQVGGFSVDALVGVTPDLKVNDSGIPNIVYRVGGYPVSDIYFKIWDGRIWNTINSDSASLNVSQTTNSRSTIPELVLDGDVPHVVYIDNGLAYYRWWNGTDWVTASGNTGSFVCSNDMTVSCSTSSEQTDCGWYCHAYANVNADGSCTTDNDCGTGDYAQCLHNRCQSEDIAVNWGLQTCDGTTTGVKCYDDNDCGGTPLSCKPLSSRPYGVYETEASSFDLYDDSTPGVLFRGSTGIYYLKWNGSTKWVSVSGGDLAATDLVISTEYGRSGKDPYVIIGKDNYPRVIWGEDNNSSELYTDIAYKQWNGSDWITVDGTLASIPPNIANQSAYISDTSSVQSYSPTVQLDRFGNPQVLWSEINYSGYSCGEFGSGGVINGINGEIHDMEIDYNNNAVYLVGVSDDGGAPHWRIDKRRFDTGELISGFGWDENVFPNNTDNGFVISDTNSLAAWNIELDIENNEFYVIGDDNNGNWRLEKRKMDSGDRVAGFGNNDDTDWPANPAGVVRLDNGNAINGVDLKIDDKYIYIVGRDDSNDWRIEKRSKVTGNLILNFGTNGVITSTDGDDARKILIDNTYMWISGHDDNTDWSLEKRLLSNGELVSGFGNGGVFSGPSSSPDSDSIFDILIDNDNIYAVGKTTDNNWLTAKLDKDTGILDTNFGSAGYVETSYASAVNFIYGIEISGDDIIIAGSLDNDWHYEIINKNTGVINPIDETNGWQNGEIDSTDGNLVWGMAGDDDYIYVFGNDDSNNWRLERRWKSDGTLDNLFNHNSYNDCKDPKYPICTGSPLYECIGGDIFYSRWTPGVVQGGIGWVEFMPAGALLGIPWVQTAYADIFGTKGVSLAPPPRGSGEYTATYLILSNGNIEGIPTNYSGNFSADPSSQLYEGGLNPLIKGSSLPLGQDALSKVNVDALVADNGEGFNRYGHPLVPVTAGDISASSELGANPLLNGTVYHIVGNATIDSEIMFMKGDSLAATETLGNGLIVIDGDLEINANILYDPATLGDITEMPSVGFIVRGNIYISPFVTNISGAFVALDNPDTVDISEGIISTSRKVPTITEIANPDDDAYVTLVGTSYDNMNLATPDDQSLKFGKEATLSGNYQYRMKATFGFSSGGVESNVPVMVKIDNTSPTFDLFWTHVSATGDDINFADADGTPLDFHLEKFEYGVEIIAWVQVPQLDLTTGTDYVWMYYGSGSTVSQQNEIDTYNNDYVGVWHLNETAGDRHNSTSTTGIDATPVGSMASVTDGMAAGADRFDGQGGTLGYGSCDITTSIPNCLTDSECQNAPPSNPADFCSDGAGGAGGCEVPDPTGSYLEISTNILDGVGNFTVEAWIRPTTNENVAIIEQRDQDNAGDGSYLLTLENGIKLNFNYWKYNVINFNISATSSVSLINGWHHLAVTIDNDNNQAIFYIDGEVITNDTEMTAVIDINDQNNTYIGVDFSQQVYWPCNKVDKYYNGDIDEVRISDTVRSAEYIKATYLAERDSGFVSWGSEDIVENRTDRAFLRFPFGPNSANDILPNSEIRSAHLKLYDDGGSSNGEFKAKIYLIDFNDVLDFTATNWTAPNLFNANVSNGMTYSLDSTTWDSTINSENISVDIKSLIQRYVNSDEYGASYANGDITHLGLVIQEGDADVGDFRSFYSEEHLTGQAPELVVEYSPRRTYYDLENDSGDIRAWTSSNYNTDEVCLNVGWDINLNRIFYRFIPDNTLYTLLPDGAEILEAHLRAKNNGCTVGTAEFQMRQGLLDYDDYSQDGSTNPFDNSVTQDVFEIAETINVNDWGKDSEKVLADISTLIQSWVDRSGYAIGNSVGLRLRRDNNANEKIAGAGEYRAVSRGATKLEIDYLVPLQVSGLFIARGYNFDRKYTKDLAPAERIVYDGRVVANTPPGLADFSKALPIYQRVAP